MKVTKIDVFHFIFQLISAISLKFWNLSWLIAIIIQSHILIQPLLILDIQANISKYNMRGDIAKKKKKNLFSLRYPTQFHFHLHHQFPTTRVCQIIFYVAFYSIFNVENKRKNSITSSACKNITWTKLNKQVTNTTRYELKNTSRIYLICISVTGLCFQKSYIHTYLHTYIIFVLEILMFGRI